MNRNNQVPHLTQDTAVTISQFNTTNDSQEVSPFAAGDHKAAMSRRDSTEITQIIHQMSGALERQ